MFITGRLVAVAALCVLLALAPPPNLVFAALILLALVVIDLTFGARINWMRVSRAPSASVRLGEAGESVLTVRNVGRMPWRVYLRDSWVPSAGAAQRPIRVGFLAPGEAQRVVIALRPTRRGERGAAVVTLRSPGPFGLAGIQRRLQVPGTIRVLPPFTSRRFLPEKLSRLRQIDGGVLMRQRGQGSEFDSLREYVAGDDTRAIDWRASARHRDTMVRTFRPERDRHLVLALDTGRSAAARIGDEPLLDAAIDASLLLAALAGRAGDRVAMVASDTQVRARLPLSTRGDVLARLVDALTPLQPSLVETDPQLLVAQVLRSTSKRALVVLFSALSSFDEAGGAPLAAIAALAQRHQVILASPLDPALEQLARDRHDPTAIYTAAAAESALQSAAQTSARLTRMGVVVLSAPADRFASAVADAYLDMKAAGRL